MSSMDSDEVNSISDTVESMQVANCLRDSYYEIMAGANPPDNDTLFSLIASGDPTRPTIMFMPDGFQDIKWLFYNLATKENPQPDFEQIQFVPIRIFIERMFQVGSDDEALDDVGTFNLSINGNEIPFFYRSDRCPQFYTSVDDTMLVFDSYDNEVDSTLQSSKTVCWGEQTQTWQFNDSFIPNCPDHMFPLLENEAKKQAFIELKQSQNALAVERSQRGWVRQRRLKQRIPFYHAAEARIKTRYGRQGIPYRGIYRTYGHTN